LREFELVQRRQILKSIVNAAVGAGIATSTVDPVARADQPARTATGNRPPFLEMSDGTQLFYREAGEGPSVAVFVHGNGATSQVWQYQMGFLADHNVHCIAFDRRGHGRSSDPGRGFNFDTFAEDLASSLSQLGLKNIVLVSHSMGAGEVVRYLASHGSDRVSRLALVSPTTPLVMKTPDNPNGVDKSILDQLPPKLYQDFPKWAADNAWVFLGQSASEETVQWRQRMADQCSLKAMVDVYRATTETDFRAELPHIAIPTLIVHGDADRSAPLDSTARRTAALIRGSELKVYPGAPHMLMLTEIDRLNRDLLAFINA
jgi:non-heme chloroperoxidase